MGSIGAAGRFGDTECGDNLATANSREISTLLAFVAARGNDRADQRRQQQDIRGIEIVTSEFLEGDAERDIIEFLAAIALFDHRREQTHLAKLAHYAARQVFVLIAIGVGGRKFTPAK